MTTYANFRKVLRVGVDSEIFIRTRSSKDSRRTLYSISDEMVRGAPKAEQITENVFEFIGSAVLHMSII